LITRGLQEDGDEFGGDGESAEEGIECYLCVLVAIGGDVVL
jgi:hypothetical protein